MNDSFEKLEVWKKAHKLTLEIYKLTNSFPEQEKYRLNSQLCRSASSVPANIAEGKGRHHIKEFKQFLYIARGSLEETKYHLILARDLGYVDNIKYKDIKELADEVGRMLNGLINSLTTNNQQLTTNKGDRSC